MNSNTVVKKVVDYIEAHIDEDLSLDKIADALNYSKFYIVRIFTKETGCTVYKYIQGRRLTMAARKLVETEVPIVEIAYEAHYDSQQAFTQAFKQLYECTPKIYRKNGVFYPGQSKMCMMSSLNGYSFMRYSFMRYSFVRYSFVRYSFVRYSLVRYSLVRYSFMNYLSGGRQAA